MIAQGADMQTVARLLCLASITTGGIKARVLEGVKREFLQVRSVYEHGYLYNRATGIRLRPFALSTLPVFPATLHPPAEPLALLYTTHSDCNQTSI